jgi:hypothetical protein
MHWSHQLPGCIELDLQGLHVSSHATSPHDFKPVTDAENTTAGSFDFKMQTGCYFHASRLVWCLVWRLITF